MHATALTEPRLQVLYRLDGDARAPERELPLLSGYRGSRPVRIGNGAIEQRQPDIYGDLLETAWLFSRGGLRIDSYPRAVLGRIADLLRDICRQPSWRLSEVLRPPLRLP